MRPKRVYSRKNQINPKNGEYASISYRPSFTFLGSDANWQSLIFDMRKNDDVFIDYKHLKTCVSISWSWIITDGFAS